jgi:hypothetical protein
MSWEPFDDQFDDGGDDLALWCGYEINDNGHLFIDETLEIIRGGFEPTDHNVLARVEQATTSDQAIILVVPPEPHKIEPPTAPYPDNIRYVCDFVLIIKLPAFASLAVYSEGSLHVGLLDKRVIVPCADLAQVVMVTKIHGNAISKEWLGIE